MSEQKTKERGIRRAISPRVWTVKVHYSELESKEIEDKAKKLHLPIAVFVRMASLNYRRRE